MTCLGNLIIKEAMKKGANGYQLLGGDTFTLPQSHGY